MTAAPLALIDRPDGAILFDTPAGRVSAAAFLAQARALAATLPAAANLVNACRDAHAVALGIAAALLRGQVSLLSGDPSPATLARLAEDYPGAAVLTDADVHAAIAGAGQAGGPMPEFAAGQPAMVVLTSGTTGRPVGTRKCWGELVARSRAAGERFVLAEDAPAQVLATVPPGHMYGLETTVLLPLHAAAAVRGERVFFPGDIGAALATLGGNAVLVTTPLHLRAALDGARPARPPGRVISATAPLDPALAARAEREWGCAVLEIFGASEVGSIASRRTVADDDWALYPGVTLALADDTPMVAAPHAATRRLADRVALSADGRRFRLLGRDTDTVKLAGRRASLAGLARLLMEIEGVRDGVFVAPDDLDRNPIARLAAIAVAPGLSAERLMEALRARVEPAFLPRPLVLVDEIPRDGLGKAPRAGLLALLAARAP